ncbi:MAG: iron chaperone [Candidatus Limnocylindrales bacterium]
MAPATVDEYLAGLPDDKRAALERLRAQIRAALPDATETIGYGMPAYRIDGRYALGFGVTKTACSFYTGRAPLQAHAEALASYRLWKGTINFKPDAPLPADIVAKLIATRVAEIQGGPIE